MFPNQSIFTQLHPAGSTRLISIPDGELRLYSKTAVGEIQGLHRTIPALMANGVSEGDLWYTINFENSRGGYVETVAVLGATSEEQAKAWAHKQFSAQLGVYGYASVNISDEVALKRYLDRPSAGIEKLRIYQRDLDTLRQQITGKPVTWNEDQQCVSHGSQANLLYDMVQHDAHEELMDAMTRADLAEYASIDSEQPEYDALIVQHIHLERMMNRLTTAMARASNEISVTSLTQSKPFKRHGVVNVACLFELSDGQSITIIFHNPDSTPGRLAAGDVMTSWKWLLNKRDISAAVQPKQGENVQLNQLAVRMMRLVKQNSARFKRNQLRREKNLQILTKADQRISTKQEQLAQVLKECEQLQQEIDKASQAQPLLAQPITLTGKELGDFPETAEGKKQLRVVAKAEFEKLSGEWVDCSALGGKVELRTSGIKKVLSLSSDARKLKVIPQIKEMISRGKKVSTLPPTDKTREPNIKAYHILRVDVMLEREQVPFRLVIREDDKGQYHYDHAVEEKLAIAQEKTPSMDGASSTTTTNGRGVWTSPTNRPASRVASLDNSIENKQKIVNSDNTQEKIPSQGENLFNGFDSADGDHWVLNLFIEGEDNVSENQFITPITSNEAARLIADLKKLNSDEKWSDGKGDRYSTFYKRILAAQEGDLEAVKWAKDWLTDLDAQEAEALKLEQERLAAQEAEAQQREAVLQQQREAGTADNPIYQAWLNTLENPADAKNHEFMAWVSERDAEFKQEWTGEVPATPDQNSDYALARISYFKQWAVDHLADRLVVDNTINPDQEFLQNIINGTVEATTVDMDYIIEIAEKYQDDEAVNALVEQALEVINQAEQSAAHSVA